jgi:hypothetical protein
MLSLMAPVSATASHCEGNILHLSLFHLRLLDRAAPAVQKLATLADSQEIQHRAIENFRLLDIHQVAGVVDDLQVRIS